MNAMHPLPPMSLSGEEDRDARQQRLTRAYGIMQDVVDVLWPRDRQVRSDPDAVRWQGAIVSLHEAEEQLFVTWHDEDHHEKFAQVAELAWEAAGQEGAPVIHENADLSGRRIENHEHLY